ncbi:MAG: hypothetical protein ACE5FF_06525, partial [Saprospiraceae bacterium]
SNPRPRPWQGRALPTELLPHFILSLSFKRVQIYGYLLQKIKNLFPGILKTFHRETITGWW